MRRKAFTLIELAIALTVIGLMIGASFQAIKAMRERGKVTEAKEQIRAAKDAIMGYALKWPNLPLGSEFQNDLSPVKNNQHPIFYAADTNLATINNDVCAYTTTSLSVVDNGTNPVRTINNVAFVLVHEGANYNMQTALNGSGEVHVYGADKKVDDNTTPVNIVDFYDDIVEWVTLDELQHNVRCSDTPLRIINNYLPSGIVDSPYSATIYVDGNYSTPTLNCVPNSFNGLTYSNYTISGMPASSGTFRIDCSVSADGRDASRAFAITIDPLADSNGTGN